MNQFRSALRFLVRHRGYTGINILGLTLGFCACLVIFDIVIYEYSFDRTYPDRDRIYRVGGHIRIDNGNGVINESYGKTIPAPAPDALRSEVPLIEALSGYYLYDAGVTSPVRLGSTGTTILADKEYFEIFPYTWLAGSAGQSLSEPYQVVLTASRARDYFGDLPLDRYIGHELVYDDSLHVRVSGIIKDYEGNTDFRYTDFISFATIQHSWLKNKYRNDQWAFNPGIPRIQAFVKLSRSARLVQASALFDSVWRRHNTAGAYERFLKFSMVLQPLGDVHFDEGYDNDGIRKAHRPALYGLVAAAVFVLLLAIVNFINLSTAQSLQRAKDISIRRILGATPIRLMVRSILETIILVTFSAVIALALVRPVMGLFHDYIPEGISFVAFSSTNILFAIGMIVFTTCLAGFYPAISLVRLRSSRALQTGGNSRFSLRRVLIVFQFSISLFFIMASLVVGRQINYMLEGDMGFNSTAVVTVAGSNVSSQQLRLFARQALEVPGVSASTVQGQPPAGGIVLQYPMKLDNRAEDGLSVNLQAGDDRFIPFYHMRLLAGRNLSSGDSPREFVINETYSKALGFVKPADAPGHMLTWQGQRYTIAGVVADYHTASFHSAVPALAIARLVDRDNSVGLRIVLNDRRVLARLETLWKGLFHGEAFSYGLLEERIAGLYKKDQQLSWVVRASTFVTIFVSCIGLLGLVLFTVERKKKEIGVRKVLGAGVADIVFLLNKEFMVLAGIALVIASPLAFWGMRRWLEGFAYRISISWWIFVLAGLIIAAISLLTIGLRAVRAALVNPADHLRSE